MTTMASHKRRGKGFETDLLKWLRARGYRAERLALAGKDDEGDVVVYHPISDKWDVIEAKAPGQDGRISLGPWLKEAEREADNFAKARGIDRARVSARVVIKARGKSLDQAYWISTIGEEYQP